MVSTPSPEREIVSTGTTRGESMTGTGRDTDREGPEDTRTAEASGEQATAERPKRFRWRSKDYSPEEIEEAKQVWRKAMPWDHPMSRGDKFLVVATLGVLLLMLATMPL